MSEQSGQNNTTTNRTRALEHRMGEALRSVLPPGLSRFVLFVMKLGWASLFGGLILIAILVSRAVWNDDWPIARYDVLLVFAVVVQALFLILRLETLREARVILLFHLTGTAMELFKTQAGSWAYPEASLFRLGEVPLFSGFMYASVGSFMARAIRVFDMRFVPYPPYWASVTLSVAIYLNFFTHHFLPDIRLVLFAAAAGLFLRTRVTFRVSENTYWMPLLLAAFLSSFFLWVAENVGTHGRIWLYAGQNAGEMVSLSKMGSWFLLLWVSFTTVTLVFREALIREDPARREPPKPMRPASTRSTPDR